MRVISILPVLFIFFFLSCQKEEERGGDPGPSNQTGSWLVPFDEILFWGSQPDRIQSIDDPHFERVSESQWADGDRMLVQSHEGQVKVYPVHLLEVHEIVNDAMAGYAYAVTYCPITGSGMSWDRTIGGEVTEFGVSGMLFRDNLIPYDRNTGSYWSQMMSVCIHGDHLETVPRPGLLFETDFQLLRTHFPEAEVLMGTSLHVCTDSICSSHKSTGVLKSETSSGSHINPGDYYYGVIDRDQAILFNLGMFQTGIGVYTFGFRGKRMVVAGSSAKNVMVSFEAKGNLTGGLTPLQDMFPLIMTDDEGNVYDVFGQVVSGPRTGSRLNPGRGYRAKGFAWEALFSKVEMYQPQ